MTDVSREMSMDVTSFVSSNVIAPFMDKSKWLSMLIIINIETKAYGHQRWVAMRWAFGLSNLSILVDVSL